MKTAQVQVSGQRRASKLIGLNVYNDKNEKIGDINEILVDMDGKIAAGDRRSAASSAWASTTCWSS